MADIFLIYLNLVYLSIILLVLIAPRKRCRVAEEEFGARAQTRLLRSIDLNTARIERYLRPVGIPNAMWLVQTLKDGSKKRMGRMTPIQQGESLKLSLEIVDAGGNAARVQDDKIAWSQADESIGAFDAAEGLSNGYKPSGKVGKNTLFAKGDADLGEGVVELIGTAEIEVLSGQAVVMSMKVEVVPKAEVAAKKK